MAIRKELKHIMLPHVPERRDFAPVFGFDKDAPQPPKPTARQLRYLHATKLNNDFSEAFSEQQQAIASLLSGLQIAPEETLPISDGISLEIEGSSQNELRFEALENRQGKPIELLNVRILDGKTSATIFVPTKKIDFFKKKLEAYGDVTKDSTGTLPSTVAVDSIETIKFAKLTSFWMEDTPFPENVSSVQTWEVWVRKGMSETLKKYSKQYGIKVSEHHLKFHECEICLITSSLEQLSLVQVLAAPLIGFCRREAAPSFYTDMGAAEQQEWMLNLEKRLVAASHDAPAVCILDTGVHNQHALLKSSLADKDLDAHNPDWGTHDHDGHGTQMAGLSLLGDLTNHLSSLGNVIVNHRLESVKILPPTGQNSEELFGWVTQDAVSRAIVNAPKRQRVFCLAVTNPKENNDNNGKPTAWSSAIDKISMGVDANLEIDDNNKQLFIVSVGNIRDEVDPLNYPSRNDLESVENPSQAWNALSVGAVTFKTFVEDKIVDGWGLVAPNGGISPRSRTSISWEDKEWPIKPDVVCEGGNYITDGKYAFNDPDLSLLTTGHNEPLKLSRDTSAATAEVSRIAAIIHAEYPKLWPETVRGLIIHSAAWTPLMLENKKLKNLKQPEKENLLRRFGYGIPNLENARHCASNRPSMISERTIQPFFRGAGDATFKDINLHKLPWPKDYLLGYGETKVRLRITLSYFIEPSPSKRIPTQKCSYASHKLSFFLQRPLENGETFKMRVNKKDRPVTDTPFVAIGKENWTLGKNTRNKGGVISDIWEGTAAELASQEYIAVAPENGWWKFRKHLNRTNQKTRYSLIVTLECDNEEIDVHQEIVNKIANELKVSTEITT